MFKQLLLTTALTFSTFSFAQVTTMINDKNLDDTTKVYGMSFLTDETKAYDKYNFILENKAAIEFAKPLLEYGYQLSNGQAQNYGLMVYVVKDKKVVDQWLVNPALYNVFHDGVPYSYDADKLSVIAEKYPLIYKEEKRVYKNEKEYKKEREALFRDPYNLIITEPSFDFEGYFEVQFPKNEQFQNPQAIGAYLRPMIEKITKKKFEINYALSEKNILDRNQFTITILGDENVYKKLKLENLEKGAWNVIPLEAFLYKKNN